MPQQPDGVAGPTIHDVARRAGVSSATVSRALRRVGPTSPDVRARVSAAVAELGYVPLRRAAPHRRRKNSLGIVLPDAFGSYFAELLLGLAATASANRQRIDVVVTAPMDDPSRATRELATHVDGLVIAPGTVPDSVAASVGRDVPVVLLSRPWLAGCDAVSAENVDTATRLTTHLFDHGRRHLVFVGDPDSSTDAAGRYRGYRLAHAAAGLPLRRPPLRVPLVEAAGIHVADELLRRRVKVDAVVCANDELAVAVMKRLQDNRVRVPDDLAVVGWDDVSTARYVCPGLTTVHQPVLALARHAVHRLLQRIDGGGPAGEQAAELPSELVLRASCGCTGAS